MLEEIVIPYIEEERKKLGLDVKRPALLIFDVFKGQTTPAVTQLLMKHNIFRQND